MDPDATLQHIRQICAAANNPGRPNLDDAEVLVEAISALDHWLSRGGFLPTDWDARFETQEQRVERKF
jgi:hypothetical protein